MLLKAREEMIAWGTKNTLLCKCCSTDPTAACSI